MALKNGGHTGLYTWGQTLEEVTVRLPVDPSLRAKELSVAFTRCRLTVTVKRTGEKLLTGELQQPILCDECSWMLEDGDMVLQLAKDNKRAENVREGPSSEWWQNWCEKNLSSDMQSTTIGG